MPNTIRIEIQLPAGTAATVSGLDPVERYWQEYLSPNGRLLYGAAAAVERRRGRGLGYTLHDVADAAGITYERARSIHRTSGRTAKRWHRDTGTDSPIELLDIAYRWDSDRRGMRTTFALPDGVADAIASLDGGRLTELASLSSIPDRTMSTTRHGTTPRRGTERPLDPARRRDRFVA